ncbi:MAG: amino acid adenylation domain-containing protein [Muribaculaceae bacterium]|nr:amino acid adenylation domain-containing protein [Muribaculaceae bacterium]
MDNTIVSLFRRQAKETPENIAVVFKDKKYTYAEVDDISDRIAGYIASKGLKEEDVVSVLIPRCEWMAIASLGVLKAGCAYQPLDPSYPKERLNFMMQDASAKLLIADEQLRPIVDEYQGEALLTKDILSLTAKSQSIEPKPESLFILLYTSGSTGVPKGCMLEHRNVVTFCDWYRRYYDQQPGDHVAAYASYGFDACMMDMYPALLTGATVYIIPEEIRLDLIALNDYFEDNHVTHAFMTTQVGCQFAEMDNHSLKHLSVGGESFIPVDPPAHFQLHNGYGPTECTIFSTIYPIRQYEKNAPIGKPLDSFRLYVVDQQGGLVENGQEGELWISGPQVGRGYLNRPEQNAQAFTPNPFCQEPDYDRVYHTGDIVRWLPDGNLQFIGRRDGQVKIRGFRIEMREVEGVIKEFPGIKDVTVQAFDEDGGGKYIAAYIVSDEQIDIEALNNFILERKPPYMVPAVTMQIERIPLNQNQKVDKRALPQPSKEARSQMAEVRKPENELQRELVEMVGKIIHNTEFGIDTPLRYVGLTSISAIRLAATAYKQYGVALDARNLVKDATILMIEEAINHQSSSNAQNQSAADEMTVAPLSFSQTGVYVDCINNPEDTQYNIPWVLGFPADTDTEQLRKAVQTVLEAHKHIFVHFEAEGDDIVQHYAPVDIDIPVLSLTDEQLTEHKKAFVRPFDLSKDVLCRMEIAKTESGVYLLLDIHHLVFDGSSLDLFIVQLCDVLEGKDVEAETYTHLNHAADEQQESTEAHKVYYDNLLGACEGATELPSDLTTPHECEKSSELYRPIDLEAVERFCREHPVTPAHLTLAATLLVFARFTGNEDLYISTVSSGRSNIRIQNTFGMFVNTLPFAAKITDVSVMDFIKDVSKRFDEAMRHEQYPFARIAEDYGYTPELAFAYQLGMVTRYMQNGHEVSVESLEAGAPKFRLLVRLEIHNGQPCIVTEYDNGQYSESLVAQLTESIDNVLKTFINQPQARLYDISLLSVEQTQLLDSFNETDVDYDDTQTIVSLFRRQVRETPDNIAVVYKDTRLTYREVDELSDRIAGYIVSKGLGLEDVVSILIPRGEWMPVASLGVLKAGCAYQPLDPTYPKERLNFMMQDAGAKLLIADEQLRPIVDEYQGEVLLTKDLKNIEITDYQQVEVFPDNLFILLYTSGSTGTPKGCQLTHSNLVAFIHWYHRYFDLQETDKVTAYASYGFDANMLDTYPPLTRGAAVYIIPEELRLDLIALNEYFEREHITNAFMTTQVAYQFATTIENHSLKHFTTGGEKLASLEPPKGYKLHNAYGPTETTVLETCYQVDQKLKNIPIGKAIDNMHLYVVDPQGHRLPVGAVGELWASGPQVGRGYLNRPEKTAEVFIENPFSKEAKYRRIYRTGDIVRYLSDGNIQFVGRSDGQVKIRGFRIELKEVETVIREFPGIKDATVQAFDEPGGGKFIAAYIVSDEQVDIDALNNFILDQKPPYMVPAVTMQIDSIPLNQNQKVNKKALPVPEKKASSAEVVNAPLNVLEEELHELIAGIINNTDFGITTILGYAGLSSISAIRLAVQVNKRYGVTLDSKSLVKSGTLQSIENEILKHCLSGEAQSTPQAINQSHEIAAPVSLSYPQQGLYVECMKNPTAIVYNIPASVTFSRDVTADKLVDAVADVVRLHPLFACHFELQGDETVQVWNKEHEAIVGRQQMSDAEYERYKHEFVMPFRLNEGPLYRLEVIETETALHLLADFHHLIFDGASFDIFFSQVAARLNGEPIEAEQYTYADYVKNTEESTEAKEFFSKVLAGCEDPTEIPADLQGAEEQGHTGEAVFPIDMNRVEQFCHTQGITPANLLLGAVYYTISRYAATRDVYMSTISNGRSDVRLSDTVGMFVNTLALHGHISEGTVKDFLNTVSTNFDETMRHEQYPFARVAADYGFYSKINFVYQMGVINEYKIGETPIDIETMELDIPKFKACVLISPHQGQPSVVVQYDDAFYSQQMMAGLAESIAAVAYHFIDTPDASLRSISIMSERQRLMVEPMHEEGRGDIPVLFLHQGMEQQAAQHPDRLALVASDATFTYAEFNAAANRIANALMQRGVKPRDRVAMLLPRTSRVMLSMYGILKTGAAFIPCDPHYPADRIQLILDDSDARYIITDAEHANLAPADKMLDVEELLNCQLSELSRQPDITPDDLAYLIYTSGSTGRPKGVMLHHRGICNELTVHPVNKRNFIAKNEGHAVLGLTSLSFDGSFVEHGLALFNGLTFVLVHDDYVNDPLEVTRLMDDNHVDIICSAQSRLVSFMASDGFMEALRHCIIVMCGGEKFPDGLMRRLQEQVPQAHIFNCYGPTETTVESNCHELTHEEQVTVGRPLLNMQERIVDQDLNELPVGVVGELLIGGVQVAHGYNKLPEKTDAAFITWQGQRFYRSGDFARWDEKGNVHILGRTDNQVKLRGQRIELGEIESVMMKVEGVNNVIVLIRKLNGKDHLCAYFVADREIPIDQMKAQISKSLTTYMVPTAYLQLPEMPVTPNGKINTKVLPEPQMVAVGEYIAPQNETEQTFCEIFAEVLEAERVGATDSFFDLGGTSLNVTRVIIEADKRGVHVAYGDVFTNPTPRQLAALFSGADPTSSESGDAAADRNFNYIPLDTLLKQNTLDAFRQGSLQKIGNVLLTGPTGYLGIHILKELIERDDVPVIWCMVRAESEEKAQNRLKSFLYFYFANNFKELFGTRIRVVLGDVTKDFSHLSTLTSDFPIDTVINCAAVVKHFSSGTDIEDVNIGGAVNCMTFCVKTGARLIHTSTYSIGGMSVEGRLPADTVLSERDLYFGQYLDNQYIHSKFVAERTVLDGIAHHGLKAKIMRLGNLAPRSTDGEFQMNFQTNSSMGRIRVFKMLGCYPYDISDDAMEFSPINEVAHAIVLLSQTPDSCCVFHPYNNHPVLFGDVLAGLSKVGGVPVKVEAEEFARKMEEAKANPERAKLLQSLMAYQDMAHGQQVRTIEPVNQYTSQVLYRLGFSWSATSWDYIERFLIAINGFGYFDME